MAKVDDLANGEPQPDIHRKLTDKQERFVRGYLQSGNASEAYRNAYDCPKASSNTVRTNAYKLLAKPYIAHTIQTHRARQQKEMDVTVEELTTEYRNVIKASSESGNFGPVVSAITGLGKLHGLITDKVDVNQKLTLSDEFEQFIRNLNGSPAPKQLEAVDVEAIELKESGIAVVKG